MKNSFVVDSDFTLYKEAFLEENSKHNLISKNDEKLLWEKHIYDSLAIKLFLEKYNIKKANVLDIGCGGGFPCLPVAIEVPFLNIVGVDSIRKKIGSVQTISDKLGLTNLELICDRVENIRGRKFDVIISRAVADMSKICEYALPLLKKGGYFVGYKSKKALEELEDAKPVLKKYSAEVVDIIEYTLPLEEVYERNLVCVKKL
ncbi:MAG: 16S rRNA (guanine(527)-N(7))-methyltransferase RsmG [Cyanobacteria bacterium SIG31]|nr:16S rRNA (guanine(527)-N(7))-methyltransferase RsmG [Cyanobacteria bacterium SIG31]